MLKKFLAGATTLLLALGVVTLTAGPASAHDAIVTSDVSCVSGTSATITWSIQNDWSTASSVTQVTGNAVPSPSPLGVSFKKNQTQTFTQSVTRSDVGTTFTLGVQMTWSDYVTTDSGSVTIAYADFSCGDDTNKPITICHATASASNPWVSQHPDANSIVTGLGGHGSSGVNVGDIIPPFTYMQNGEQKSYPGNNWDAAHQLIYNNGCSPVNANTSAPAFGTAVCTAFHTIGQGSVTMPATTTGIAYSYSTNGTDFVAATAGTSYPVAVGTTVTVHATALAGYTIPNNQATSWSQTITGPDPLTCVVTVAPTSVDSSCTTTPGGSTQASYTIPSTTGVVYLVNGSAVSAGAVNVNTFPTSITITAQPANGYAFPPGTTLSWPTIVFSGPGDCRALAVASADFQPSVCTGPGQSTDPTFTLGSDTNVVYTVTINGNVSTENLPGSTYSVGASDTVSIDAVAATNYKLNPDAPFHSQTTFVAKPCLVDVAPVEPHVTPQICVVGEDGPDLYFDGEIDIPATTGVTYTIDGTIASAGPNPVGPGDHTVAAIALTGYQLDASYTGPWTVTSAAAEPCGGVQLPTEAIVTPIVTAPEAGCTATGTYTLDNDLGIASAVVWTADGSPITAGSHSIAPGTVVRIHAEPNGTTYGFVSDQQTDWTISYALLASCGQLATLALTGSPLPIAVIGAAGLLLIAGLSLMAVHLVRRRHENG